LRQPLTERYRERLAGVLSCYDRIIVTGTLFSVENEIMVRCLAHHMALAFRSTIELVEPGREFNPILAAIVSPESLVRPDISTQVVVLD
jgi:hypothetical protein